MGRSYAVMLGSIAFAAAIARGLAAGDGVESTMQAAVASLAIFAALGGIVGRMAAQLVDDGVRGKFVSELAGKQKSS